MFLLRIRDRTQHQPLPGITIGDCGKKIGLDGMDNGFMIFRDHRAPREALLDRLSTVDSDGTFKSQIKSANKRFAFTMGALSGGRVIIARAFSCYGIRGLVTATRYAYVRR